MRKIHSQFDQFQLTQKETFRVFFLKINGKYTLKIDESMFLEVGGGRFFPIFQYPFIRLSYPDTTIRILSSSPIGYFRYHRMLS